MKFAHLADCHLGGWRFPELQELNMQSFAKAIDISIKEKVDMILIAGDLFDSAYPPIEILKQTFAQFKKLNDSKIPCFLIAGSHDYSVSGKTFLDVLEHAGFCKNVYNAEEIDKRIILKPTIFDKYAIYGYPGKKSGIEISELKNLEIQDSPGFFKIFLLHTALTEALGTLPIDSVSLEQLPSADYYALGHLHINFMKKNALYSGPIFPNNFEELEELGSGQFYIIEVDEFLRPTKIPLKLKEVLPVKIEITNSFNATEKIFSTLNNLLLENKIVLLRLTGNMLGGKISDIRFNEIEKFVESKKAFTFIKSISGLIIDDLKIHFEAKDIQEVEKELIEKYAKTAPEQFKDKFHPLLKILSNEKQEDESNATFQGRVLEELKKSFNLQ